MPYYAQPRLDGTYEPVDLFCHISLDAGSIQRLRITLSPPRSLEVYSDERYSNLTVAEALDVLAATLDLAGGTAGD